MKLTGEIRNVDGEGYLRVTDAILRGKRLSIDWEEDGYEGHLEATSKDGWHFSGNYGYPEKDSDLEFELTLFRTRDETLLLGSWCNHYAGDEGMWFLRLRESSTEIPSQKRAVRKSRTPKKKESSSRKERSRKTETQPLKKSRKPTAPTPTKSKLQQLIHRDRVRRTREEINRLSSKPLPGSQLDHLLTLTEMEVTELGNRLTEQLTLAPVAAVFKVAREARVDELRIVATQIFNKRWGPVSSTPHSLLKGIHKSE